MEGFLIFFNESVQCMSECISVLNTSVDTEFVIHRIESIMLAARDFEDEGFNLRRFLVKLEHAVSILTMPTQSVTGRLRGRPEIHIDISSIERLLALNFKGTQIATLIGISYSTLKRKLQSNGITIRNTYTELSHEDLARAIESVLRDFPNTGYKKMKGFLRQRGLKVTEYDIREMIRIVDPVGVYNRTRRNRAIVRREYFVQYSNEMWHIDTHHKLIRWKFVIRGGIDGKSRTCLYLDAGGDNKAATHLAAFTKATEQYGVPYRCRSDKGGENVDIAKFMLTNRGLGRASHICGRSVHNQRIERFWGDVHSGCLTQFKIVFIKLEEDGYLDVENELSLALLHYIYQPRLQQQLQVFRDSWNCHPLSTSHNMTPHQLLFLHLPPPHLDLTNPVIDEGEDSINTNADISRCMDGYSILNEPAINETALQTIASRVEVVNLMQHSEYFGYDLYVQAFNLLQNS